jgi:hypothetical protein
MLMQFSENVIKRAAHANESMWKNDLRVRMTLITQKWDFQAFSKLRHVFPNRLQRAVRFPLTM